MEIKIVREQYRSGSTVGRMLVDDDFECFTLEDRICTNNVYGDTAIPPGIYRVVVNFSQTFEAELPLVLNVPMYDGIRIHGGDTQANTPGCILVGRNWTPGAEVVSASRLAFAPLFRKICTAIERGEQVVLHVIQETEPQELEMTELPREAVPETPAADAPTRRPATAKRPVRQRSTGRKTGGRSAAVKAKTSGPQRSEGRGTGKGRKAAGVPTRVAKAAGAASRSTPAARSASASRAVGSAGSGATKARRKAARKLSAGKAPGKSAARKSRRSKSR
jgi:hypothetical protein